MMILKRKSLKNKTLLLNQMTEQWGGFNPLNLAIHKA